MFKMIFTVSKNESFNVFRNTLYECINFIDELDDVLRVDIYENDIHVLFSIVTNEGRRWYTV